MNNTVLLTVRVLVTTLLWLSATLTNAGPLPIWQLQGTDNQVLLMGSVHFLRATDYPLPLGMDTAYLSADKLVMELDLDSVDPASMQAVMTTMAMNEGGVTLREVIGDSSYAEAANLAQQLGVPLAMFDTFKPWFAALSITQMRMRQLYGPIPQEP